MRRSNHARSWSVLIAATGTLMLAGCNSTDSGDGVTAGAANANGGAQNLATGGTTAASSGGQSATGGTTASSSGGQLLTGGTTAVASGGLPSSGGQTASSTGGTTAVATGGKPASSGGASTGGVSVQAGGVAGTAQAGSAGAVESDFKCQSDDDCCAVVDNCYNRMEVVGLPFKAALEAQIAGYDQFWCNSCIPPQVQVTCVNGECLGYRVGSGTTWPGSGLSGTHCGVLSTGGTSGVSASVERVEPIVAAFAGASSTGGASTGGASTGGASTGGTSSTLGIRFGCI